MPLLWAAVSAVAAVCSTPLGHLSDRIGRLRLLTAGYVAYAVFYLGMAWFAEPGWRLYLLFGLYGLFMAATEGVERALLADLAPASQRGTAFGWFNLLLGAVLLPASVLFGWLWEACRPRSPLASRPAVRCWRRACWWCGCGRTRRLMCGQPPETTIRP